MKKSQVIVDGAVQQCKDEATIQVSVGPNCSYIYCMWIYYQFGTTVGLKELCHCSDNESLLKLAEYCVKTEQKRQ